MPTMTRTAELASTMRGSVMRLSPRLRTERADHDLTLPPPAALAPLARPGPLTPRELADHEHVQPPSLTRTLAALEEQGLITRTPHATDGRQHLVALTTEAKALLKEDRRRRDSWLSRRLSELTQEERDLLRAAAPLLDRLTSAV